MYMYYRCWRNEPHKKGHDISKQTTWLQNLALCEIGKPFKLSLPQSPGLQNKPCNNAIS